MSWTLCTCLMSLNCLNSKPRTWSTDIHYIKLHIWEQQLESCCGLQAFKDVFLFGLWLLKWQWTIQQWLNHCITHGSLATSRKSILRKGDNSAKKGSEPHVFIWFCHSSTLCVDQNCTVTANYIALRASVVLLKDTIRKLAGENGLWVTFLF